jgi:hypothetical protein
MEINTVPGYQAADSRGITYLKLPTIQFPVDDQGRTVLVQDVTYYSKAALYDAFKAWRDGGPVCSGRFDDAGAWEAELTTQIPGYDQNGRAIAGVEGTFLPKVFDPHTWGLEWVDGTKSGMGRFPQFFRYAGNGIQPVAEADVPAETRLAAQTFPQAETGPPYTSPAGGAWGTPGPAAGPFLARLADGSTVTYSWYRFVDQPSFQQYAWSEDKKAKLQAFVEKLHASWSADRDYMAPLGQGTLAALDQALFVAPPPGLEVGYVPIVTHQEAAVSAVKGK